MDPYSIQGKTKILEPLSSANFALLETLAANDEIRLESLKYDNEFNIFSSLNLLRLSVYSPGHAERNWLFLIKKKEDDQIAGMTGITGIDMFQRRGQMILLMDKKALKAKESHEPVKLALNFAFDRDMRKITAFIYEDDQMTATVLKSFGFAEEGKIKEFVRYKEDTFDVRVFGLLKKDFHQVEF